MKKQIKGIFAIIACSTFATNAQAQADADSVKYKIDEVVVTESRKETTKLTELPASIAILGQSTIQKTESQSLKEVVMNIPNIYIPDYGAKLTSATYIRGIGSRMNTPAIGLYVDNVPFLDKSAFDFDFFDINRIEILRGAQGTLYGRNAIGGIVNVYTLSPLQYQGTNINLSAANRGTYRAQASHYAKIGNYFGVSAGAYYSQTNGFYRNVYDNSRADKEKNYGGRIHLTYERGRFKADYSLNYEQNRQNGFPYSLYNNATGAISAVSHNDPNKYHRKLLSTGLSLQYNFNNFELSSTTAFQYFSDQMDMDQDFTPQSIFTIMQAQHQRSISEEIIVKSKREMTSNFNYQWLFGVFGFYQKMNTQGPVTFKKDGIQSIIQPVFDRLHTSGQMPFQMSVKNDNIIVGGDFETPTTSGAVFHQSTFNNVLTEGLSITAGIRLDYERVKVNYFSSSSMTIGVQMPTFEVTQDMNDTILGKNSKNYVQLLPKLAVKYDFDKRSSIYASVAKGYKSGGYNIQMFSDLMQEEMASRTPVYTTDKVNEVISYKPEYSWNFELGGRSELIENTLFADAAVYYIRSLNQQISQFAPTGLGRIMRNAGRSTSYGVEFSLRARLSQNLYANAAYGYTHATFDEYTDTVRVNGAYTPVSYNDNFVPMVPRHTLMLALDYTKNIRSCFIDQFRAHLQYYGYGTTYWTEANNAKRGYYGTFNGKIVFAHKQFELSVWSKNILDKKYETFYFESLGNSFVQRSKRFQIGVDLALRF